jgi:glyoxylase-like metal-dependent hydrolase (beta-lactamase superfamily II)
VFKVSAVIDDNMTGDGETQRVFSDYETVGGMMLPTRIAELRGRDTTGTYRLDVALNANMPDSSYQIPIGYTERRPGPARRDTVIALAPDVYLVSVGYNLLAVAFDDHVFVVEAPGFLSEQAIALIQKTIPNKPIRYVALTHHHDDHAGGIRAFIARGATVVTTPGNRAFLTRVAAAQRTLSPDALSRTPQPPKFELIENGKRVYRDAHHVVELYDIGPGGHTNEMVIAYLPNEKILFQGDLLNIADDKLVPTANETTRHFAKRLKEMGLEPEVMAGVHAGVHSMRELDQSIEKARLRGW